MPNYAIYNSEGEILRTLDVSALHIAEQLGDGEMFLECDAEPFDSIDVDTLTVIKGEPPQSVVIELPEHVKIRKTLYPSVESQLDMLWHAMNAGEIPKATVWFENIKAVKDSVPVDGQHTAVAIQTLKPLQDGEDE